MKTVIKERDAMCWGSYQYDEAAAMFDRLLQLEIEIGRQAVLKQFGQSLGMSLSGENVYDKLVSEITETWKDDDDDHMISVLRDAVAEHSDKTVSNCFSICRDMAWDLWTAASAIAGYMFPTLDLKRVPLTDPKKCGGPTLNRIVQRQNDPTGFCCWLLLTYHHAEETDFMEFDT